MNRVAVLGKPDDRWSSCHLMARGIGGDSTLVSHTHFSRKPVAEYDTLLVVKGEPRSMEVYKSAPASAKKILFFMDTALNWREFHSILVKSHGYRPVCTSPRVAESIRAKTGVLPKVIYQGPMLYGDEVLDARPAVKRIKRILVFGRTYSGRRLGVLKQIEASGIPVTTMKDVKFGGELQKEILSYAGVLGVNNTTDVVSARFQTVIAMGGRIVQEYSRGQGYPDVFQNLRPEERTHYSTGENAKQLIDNCRKMLKEFDTRIPSPDDELPKRIRSEFGWEKQMARILEVQ